MRSLRSVILKRIAIVAIVSFLLSAGFTYYYYQTILVGQMVHDDKAKLSQTTRQLQYMSDDISQFAFPSSYPIGCNPFIKPIISQKPSINSPCSRIRSII